MDRDELIFKEYELYTKQKDNFIDRNFNTNRFYMMAIFVTLIVSIYLLAERTAIVKFAKKLCGAVFKEETYNQIGKYFRESNEIFFRFISSQLLDSIVVRNTYISCNVYYLDL